MAAPTEILEPVLNNDNEPCWLTRKYQKIAPGNIKIEHDANGKNPKILNDGELELVPLFELKPHAVWQCSKCGAETPSNPEKPNYCEACERNSNFKQITKIINSDLWKLPTWTNIPNDDIDMLGLYDNMLAVIKQLLVFSEEIEYKVFALWIISTWKLESWDAVGFPIFIGIPDSGKSRALRIIHNLAYRAPKASGIKAAAVPRLCHYHNITLLVDEAHNKMNPKTETGANLLDFIKDSYKKGSVYITCDNNDQEKLVVTRNFGFKAFAGEKSFNPGLLSRGLIFWMEKATPEISKLSYAEEDLNKIRTKLLNYRIKLDNPADLGNDFCLKGRTREIYESIIATGQHIGVDVKDVIKFAKKRDTREIEALKDTVQYDILKIIRDYENLETLDDTPEQILNSEILERLDWDQDRSNAQKLGYILRNMGLTVKRASRGRAIPLTDEDNKKRLMKLFVRYGV